MRSCLWRTEAKQKEIIRVILSRLAPIQNDTDFIVKISDKCRILNFFRLSFIVRIYLRVSASPLIGKPALMDEKLIKKL